MEIVFMSYSVFGQCESRDTFSNKKKNTRPNKVSASHLINAYFRTECENNERNALCKLLTFTNCPVFAQQKYW